MINDWYSDVPSWYNWNSHYKDGLATVLPLEWEFLYLERQSFFYETGPWFYMQHLHCYRTRDTTVLYRTPEISVAMQYCSYASAFSIELLQSLTHWGWDKMNAILQTTLSNAFSWITMLEFRLEFHWNLFLGVQFTIFQHWFREWLGADQATSHYLNQWWLNYRRIFASLGLIELTKPLIFHWFSVWLWHIWFLSNEDAAVLMSRFLFHRFKNSICGERQLYSCLFFHVNYVGNNNYFAVESGLQHTVDTVCFHWED